MTVRALIGAVLAVMLFFGSGGAHAQSIKVAPVVLSMVSGAMTTTLTVSNEGTVGTTVQIRPFAWRQSASDDSLTPTALLMASPPLFDLPPGQSQLIRLVLRQPAAAVESSYRILLDEIPPAEGGNNVRIALRLSIPVFAEADVRSTNRLELGVVNQQGQSWLAARNIGTLHQRLFSPKLTMAGTAIAVNPNANPYVLPGVTRFWRLGRAVPEGATLQLSAMTDTGPIERTLRVGAAP